MRYTILLLLSALIFAPQVQAKSILHTIDASTMILIPEGVFIMGDDEGLPNEKPERKVELKAFYIDETEVTNKQYRKFLDSINATTDKAFLHPDQPADKKDHTPRYWKAFVPDLLKKNDLFKLTSYDEKTFMQDDCPVVGVDWWDAYAYAKWAGKRLPTEAEWEKAARGNDGRTWPWGDTWDWKKCNSGGYELHGEFDGHVYAAPVGSYPEGSSPYGVQDVAGNVWEWVADFYQERIPAKEILLNPKGPLTGEMRVIKGGSSSNYPSTVRPATRRGRELAYRTFNLGFRCAKDAK